MNKNDLQSIRFVLLELRNKNAYICSRVDPSDGDQGACYAHTVDHIDNLIEKIDIELQKENTREIAQVHSDINEKLFGYFKL